MSYLKLLKLLYLADRQALLELGRPITFDRFVSMPNGPVLSRTCDLITSEPGPGGPSYWGKHISLPSNYEVELVSSAAPNDQLSPAEEAVLDSVFERFGKMDRWKLVAYTHTLPEWQDPHGSSVPIDLIDILRAQGVNEEDARAIEEALAAESLMEQIAG